MPTGSSSASPAWRPASRSSPSSSPCDASAPRCTAVVLNIEIVAAVGLGALILGERLSPVAVLGAVAIFVAAAWVTVIEARRADLTRSG